jgi:glycosyltransferase involved in cell wall biosynthesis
MKILHVISSIDPKHGGVTEGLRQLADVSIRLGYHVEVATRDCPSDAFLSEFSFPIHALGPGATHFQYCPRLRDWLFSHIAAFDIVVVHALWQHHTVAVRQAALRHNVPYVVYTHGMLDPYFKQAHPLTHLKKWLFWPWADYRVLRDAKAVLFTTEEERRLARQSFWLYRANEMVVNLGTARPTGNTAAQHAAFYALFPQLRGKKLALFLGRIHQKKGCDLAIQAFAKVFSSHPDWHLVMAGPDQVGWRAALEQLARAAGIADRITWTGMLQGDAKWGAIRSAEFFFLPSHQENFGVVVAEALACGLPVLISDKINIWREVQSGSAGLVAPDTLAGATSLLENWLALGPIGQSRLRASAIPCFEKKFEIQTATENLLAVLTSIVPPARPNHYVNEDCVNA